MVNSTIDGLSPSLEEAAQLDQWWEAHYDALLADYPEQFVAVQGDAVVASNPDLALLVYELRDLGLSPREDVAIEFITASKGDLLL